MQQHTGALTRQFSPKNCERSKKPRSIFTYLKMFLYSAFLELELAEFTFLYLCFCLSRCVPFCFFL